MSRNAEMALELLERAMGIEQEGRQFYLKVVYGKQI